MSIAFAHAHSHAEDWAAAAGACAAGLAGLGADANLGFVYVTDAIADRLASVVRVLRDATGIDTWVGTVGLGVCATGTEYFDRPAVAVLAGRFPAGSFRAFAPVADGFDTFDAEHGAWCRSARPRFGIVHGDPRSADVVSAVAELSERMDNGFLVGGLAYSRGAFPQVAGDVGHGGLSGVLFTSAVAVTTRLTQGCSPIGPRRRITSSRGNVLLAIDDRPALDVFVEDAGELLARDPARASGFIFAGLPVRGSDTGDYLVRNLVGVDPERRALAIAEEVDPGDAIVFCRRDAEAARADMRRMLAEIGRSTPRPPRAGVYFSCVARGPSLFGPGAEELRTIQEVLGPIPIVGFFGNGEISFNRVYGYTGVLALFA